MTRRIDKRAVFAFTMLGIFLTTGVLLGWNRTRWAIRQYLAIGYEPTTKDVPDALLYIKNGQTGTAVTDDLLRLKGMASQSGDAIDYRNSSDSTLFKVASDGDLTAVDGTFSGNVTVTGTLTPTGTLTSNSHLTVDNSDDTTDTADLVKFKLGQGQTGDVLQCEDNDANVVLKIEADGKLDVYDAVMIDNDQDQVALTVQGHSTQTNSVLVVENSSGTDGLTVSAAGNVVITGTLTQTGNASFTAGLVPPVKTSDPCGTLPARAIFLGGSDGGIFCYCDINGVDLKIDGSSAACTY